MRGTVTCLRLQILPGNEMKLMNICQLRVIDFIDFFDFFDLLRKVIDFIFFDFFDLLRKVIDFIR